MATLSKTRINAARGNEQSSAHQRKAELVRDIKAEAVKYHGEVIYWNVRGPHPHVTVVAALRDSGLDEKVAREIMPRHAFTRAARKMTTDRVIDVLREDTDYITFQFTKRVMEDEEWSYSLETLLKLDKTTGRVKCDDIALEARAQGLVDRAMEERTTSDITAIIQKLFETNADLFPLRDQGGVYFVPDPFKSFTEKLEEFVGRLGGRVGRLPIPSGTRQGDQSVAEAVADGMAFTVHELEESVDGFDDTTRESTLENRVKRIKAARVKVEAYAFYLDSKAQEMRDNLDDLNKKLQEKIDKMSKAREDKKASDQPVKHRGTIFGRSVGSVLTWMGTRGWTVEQARKVIDRFGQHDISDITVRARVQAANKGKDHYGPPAQLSEGEQKQLTQMKDEA